MEQLFPSLPIRSIPSFLSFRSEGKNKGKGRSSEALDGVSEERIGPVRALFDSWAEDRREQLRRSAVAGEKGGLETSDAVMMAIKTRLEYNVPVLEFLPEVCRPSLETFRVDLKILHTQAIATLSIPDPNRSSLPSLKSYLAHVQDIALDIKGFTRTEARISSTSEILLLKTEAICEFHRHHCFNFPQSTLLLKSIKLVPQSQH